jgi:hypothetical protein
MHFVTYVSTTTSRQIGRRTKLNFQIFTAVSRNNDTAAFFLTRIPKRENQIGETHLCQFSGLSLYSTSKPLYHFQDHVLHHGQS